MPLKIFNTLTRKKEEFKPLKDKEVKLYACGPTVYDYAHIGNMRAYVFEDILRRVLEFNGFKVLHVMNITDVGHLTSDADTGEDKLEVGARREKKTAWEIAEFYTKAFFEDMEKLNIIRPDITPKATDHVKEMIELIQNLEKKGYTYTIEDGVYFDTSKFKNYRKLSRMKLEELKAGARIEMVKGKKNPTDFALWKFSPKDKRRQMEWESPYGVGFPGWHIECSAMSMKYLGETFDIHCGGIDHIPIHHTNEIAQSEAATGKNFVNYWMHCNFLIVEGKKMAKSLGNYYTLRELLTKRYDARAIRYLLLSAHYRQQLNFTFSGLESAKNTVNSLLEFMRKLNGIKTIRNPKIPELIEKTGEEFFVYLNDDLNINNSLASMFGFMTEVNKLIDKNEIGRTDAQAAIKLMLDFDKVLGLKLEEALEKEELSTEVLELIRKRESARKVGDFKRADEIREEIRKRFRILIEDSKEGVKWRKI